MKLLTTKNSTFLFMSSSDDYEEFSYDDIENTDDTYTGNKSVLDIYGTNLTLLAQQGKLEECFGREKELLEMMEILVRRQKNNPVLVGEAGVGKTAIIELFAKKIVDNLVPFVLEGRILISLDLSKIVSGARYRGEFESRFQEIIDEILNEPNVIVFIDEIHNLGGTGSAEGSLDAANILKPVLSRSGFQCIGATTTKEYQKIEKDPALNRRFQPIEVKEPTVDQTVKILYGLRPGFEAFHNVEILPGALRVAADLASRYIHDRFLPDKAIDLIDRAAAREVIKLTNISEGSVLSSVVNAGLTHIGVLRLEAFRRGDIASEFVFQEVENAYRNFLLRWIEAPLTIPDIEKTGLSPISQSLFDNMRICVLKRVDELLFSSTKPNTFLKSNRKIKELSNKKNKEIYSEILTSIKSKKVLKLSIYRISLFLFGEFINETKSDFKNEILKTKYFLNITRIFKKKKMYSYIFDLKKCTNNFSKPINDFLDQDIEEYQELFETLSELEETRIDVFKDFLENFKPVLRKGIIESLKYSSDLSLSELELATIYNLLGYFSTETGKDFLANMEDPDLIKRSRKLGDFSGLKKRVTPKEIRELLSQMTGIPIQSISTVESQKLINLESTLHKRVIGQEEAISAIAKAIRRSRLGIQNPNRPIASFLFCGPTGVGKTEVTKALAVNMFGSENDMIRFDMSEFMEKFTISRLIGSPPGYVGYDEGGQLTDAVHKKPYSVVLFDEIEKAHPDVLNILLQILEDGRLTDSQKRLVLFDNTIIIMTSNAAAEEIQQIVKTQRAEEVNEIIETDIVTNDLKTQESHVFEDNYSGAIKFLESPTTETFLTDIKQQLKAEFNKSFRNLNSSEFLEKQIKSEVKIAKESVSSKKADSKNNVLKNAVLERLSTLFLPEFLNRLDDIIVFEPLKPEELRKICDIMINNLIERIKTKQITLSVDEKVKTRLTKEGYNPAFGARPLRRLITKYIEDSISEYILKNPINKKTKNIRIQLNEEDDIVVKKI